MSNIVSESNTLIVRTYRNVYDGSTALTITIEFTSELDFGDSNVSMSLVENYDGEKGLILWKLYREIVID